MDVEELFEHQFEYFLSFLGGEGEVDRIARSTGAFVRSRKVESSTDLLRLLMMWAVAGYSLEDTAALAAEAGIADVSDVALLGRFRRCREWVGTLLGRLLDQDQLGVDATRYRLRLLDATTVSKPGSRGIDHRLHMSLDLASGKIDAVELSKVKSGESLTRFEFQANDIAVGDRGYAHRGGLQRVVEAGAFYVIRFPWQNIPLQDRSGNDVDLLGLLRTLPEAECSDFEVQTILPNGAAHQCRLVAIRKSEPAAAASRQKILKQKRKKNQGLDPRTLEAAGYFFVLTNLPAPELSPEKILDIYRLRWQIEMKFKILKSLIGLGSLPVKDFELAQTYLMTKLIAALVIDQLLHQYESFSPWGYPIAKPTKEYLAA